MSCGHNQFRRVIVSKVDRITLASFFIKYKSDHSLLYCPCFQITLY